MQLAPLLAAAVAPFVATAAISERRFRQLCRAAASCGRPLELRGRSVALAEALKVQRRDALEIRGPGRISGSGHSVFQVEGTGRGLALRGLDVRHTASTDREEKRSLGACIFTRGKGAVTLERCRVTSEAGFGLWLVQRSSAALRGCEVYDTGRTALTVFNHARLEMASSTIRGAKPHGVCARGETSVAIEDSRIVDCGDRAIYMYMSASLALVDSVVSANARAAAAVQVEALRDGDAIALV
eukprot:CAMPEP_0119292964 /NCGR_PEP_ID=MMETSP1329-20130426/45155_1 /TAXON_ID=114041 /ORGANISM="Genus nov. species nov., Strain RCC1024" /LENGTH=241 /DNA_ID=CAMNT_0007293819 /DNA_START=104 /DNA_END=826 /DNA_ORIENTATION=+